MFEAALKEIEALEDDDEEVKEILLEHDFVSTGELNRAIKKLKVDLGLISKEELVYTHIAFITIGKGEILLHKCTRQRA